MTVQAVGAIGDAQGEYHFRKRHVVSAAEDTANTVTIATGLGGVSALSLTLIRSGAVAAMTGAVVTTTAASPNIVIADGGAYTLTAGDIIHIHALGPLPGR